MRVNISVTVYQGSGWDPLADGTLDVVAMPEGLRSVVWPALCAGLVEGVMAKAESKVKELEESDD